MGTVVTVGVDGAWVVQPQTPHEAKDRGWYQGAEYRALYISDSFPYEIFKKWCEETFQHGTYVIFVRNAWFLNEQDAVLCRLKWT